MSLSLQTTTELRDDQIQIQLLRVTFIDH